MCHLGFSFELKLVPFAFVVYLTLGLQTGYKLAFSSKVPSGTE
jgi:hypothetical protein